MPSDYVSWGRGDTYSFLRRITRLHGSLSAPRSESVFPVFTFSIQQQVNRYLHFNIRTQDLDSEVGSP